ncbi:MAG TPA: 2OG-Fe(II) oxygenase [Cyclobacteriaceae bacterium]|nr:2OG-Fe(II) oxygenase [Cyclobacteriaceae bacterium]
MKNVNEISWPEIKSSLNEKGFALIPEVLSKKDCIELINLYPKQGLYRNVINMQRYRFGQGEYKYFNYPLPNLIQKLREEFYVPLATLANQWSSLLADEPTYPETHSDFIALCHKHKQDRPTPLILHYQSGGFNTLHQDLYGEIYFPFQVVFVLSQHGADYDGGELVMTEQLPRAQSKANVIVPNQGDALVFTTNFRPVKGTRGYYKSKMKHGVSELKSGERYALGIIFHDAN